MTEPAVTIVTPSFNQGEFIRATIESVLAQTHPSLEYIVMDGGSTDQTRAIVAEYASRLTWISEKDRGQAHAINKGFSMAKAGIVAWLNSDDILLPHAVSRAVEAFRNTPHVGAIYGEGYLIDREGRVTRRFPATEPFNLWKLAYLSDYILQQSTFFRHAAVQDVGWLDESLHYALDWDLLIRLGQKFGLCYVPEYWGMLREYPETKTSSGGRRRVIEIRQVLRRHTGLDHAPGYWIYAMDAAHRQSNAFLTSHAPRPLRSVARLAHALIHLPGALAIRHVLRHAQGLYPDGWASNRMKWMLPAGAGTVVIRGTLPNRPSLRGMVLTAGWGGHVFGRWHLPIGDFEVSFRASSIDRPFLFELRSSRYVFSLVAFDVRKAAFLFRSADWQHATPSGDPGSPRPDRA